MTKVNQYSFPTILAIAMALMYFGSDFVANLASASMTTVIAIIVYKKYVNNNIIKIEKMAMVLFTASIGLWAIGDWLWFIVAIFFNSKPELLEMVDLPYRLSPYFMFAWAILSMLYGLKVWRGVQLLLDIGITVILMLSIFWVTFFHGSKEVFQAYIAHNTAFVHLIIFFFIKVTVIVWLMSIKSTKIKFRRLILFLGVSIFADADFFYHYIDINRGYSPNSLVDILYLLSFGVIAFGGILDDNSTVVGKTGHKTFDKICSVIAENKKFFYLLFPLGIFLWGDMGGVPLALSLATVGVYYLWTSSIQNGIQKEVLLQKEKEINNNLEKIVMGRTEELAAKNDVLFKLSNLDVVTGIANRRYFMELAEEMRMNLRKNETISLIYIDINGFTKIVNSFGSYFGERLLKSIAKRLQFFEWRYKNSVLSNYREDIFVIAIPGRYNERDAVLMAENIQRSFSAPIIIDETEAFVTVSMGIAQYPTDSSGINELLIHADMATIHARARGYNEIFMFDSQLAEGIYRKNNLELRLRGTDAQKSFTLYYQPQYNIKQEAVSGFEALIRWRLPTGESISPSEFIPVAEEMGYIVQIGDWVIDEAFRQIAEWNRTTGTRLTMGVNVSIKQLRRELIVKTLRQNLAAHPVQASQIELEITETLSLSKDLEVIKVLEEIREMGFGIAIDDFGTGYSTMNYIKTLPITRIKIAKNIVDNVEKDTFDREIIASLVRIAKVKNINIIAEGVETVEQMNLLKEMGCDAVQGFIIGAAMGKQDVENQFIKKTAISDAMQI